MKYSAASRSFAGPPPFEDANEKVNVLPRRHFIIEKPRIYESLTPCKNLVSDGVEEEQIAPLNSARLGSPDFSSSIFNNILCKQTGERLSCPLNDSPMLDQFADPFGMESIVIIEPRYEFSSRRLDRQIART